MRSARSFTDQTRALLARPALVQGLETNHRLLTVEELCQFLGVSKRWIHERTRRQEIPCYRFGTALRFDPEEIRMWMAKFHSHPPEG